MIGMDKENVYIIIPVHNRKEITLKCLETLKQNGDLDKYYVIVIDDGSTDGTSEAIQSLYPDVIILTGDGNLWWTGAIKKGMEYAYEKGAEYLIWLNDDCLVANDSIEKLICFCKKNPKAIIGSQGYQLDNNELIAFGGHIKKNQSFKSVICPKNQTLECDVVSGNLVCLPRLVIDIVGYPDANLSPHYFGDFIFLIKSKKEGFKIYVSNQSDILNICNKKSSLEPNRWLLQKGHPLDIIRLIFINQSILSWQVWLALNREEYGVFLGSLSFITFYTIQFLIPIILITCLRFFPLSSRYKLSELKNQTLAKILKTN
jgi:GT2 family glycosyltransferase